MSKFNSENYFLPVLNLAWLVSCLFSIAHVALYGELSSLLYSLVIAIFFAVLVVFVLSIIRKKSDFAKGFKPLVFILGIYLMLVSWQGINKTFPEYQEIVAFMNNRAQLAYNLNVNRKGARWDMAKLYLSAPESVKRIEVRVGHKGTMMMHLLLMEKVEQGNGEKYSDEMYEVAEVAFSYGKKFAREWYEKAYEYGREDAIERYNERMLLVNPKFKVTSDGSIGEESRDQSN